MMRTDCYLKLSTILVLMQPKKLSWKHAVRIHILLLAVK